MSRKVIYYNEGYALFVTKWKTDNNGSSDNNQIALPLVSAGSYDFVVDWGDGTEDTITSYNQSEVTHTYNSPGTYIVKISGEINGWSYYSSSNNDPQKLIELMSWGNIMFTNNPAARAFYGCENLIISAKDQPDLTGLTSLLGWFRGCENIETIPNINNWDVSGVTNMHSMFENTPNFNQDLNSWDVSNVTSMEFMFRRTTGGSNFNGDISNWDTSNVTTMRQMFSRATNFNQDIGSWNTGSLTRTDFMFDYALSFNQDIDNWDVSNVTNMNGMFRNANSFNQDLNSWDTSNVTNMASMFRRTITGYDFNGNISNWNTSSVTNMQNMFTGALNFNQDIGGWDTSSVTSMTSMFSNANSFNHDLSGWDTGSVTNMSSMFANANSFDQDLSSWDISSLTSASNMFLNKTLSTKNYDRLLIGWQAQSVQNNVTFSGGNSKYTDGGAGETARADLISSHSWTITDGGSDIDTDADSFLTAASITDDTIVMAINHLVLDYKDTGVWTKMYAIYPFVGGTASTHKWNLKDPQNTNAAFRLTFHGGITHSSDGVNPNGTNGYANTYFSAYNEYVNDTVNLAYYSRQKIQNGTGGSPWHASGCVMGVQSASNLGMLILIINRTLDDKSLSIATYGSSVRTSEYLIDDNGDGEDARGLWMFNADASNDDMNDDLEKNGIKVDDILSSTVRGPNPPPISNLYMFAGNDRNLSTLYGYADLECAYSHISQGLSSSERSSVENHIHDFQLTLSRNVIDDDARKFINTLSITDSKVISAINQLVIDLKASNIWDKMLAIYPFVGSTADTHKYNLKDPRDLDRANRLTFYGGIIHSSNGVQGNGTNGYADTHLMLNGIESRGGLSLYVRNNIAEDTTPIGVFATSSRGTFIIPRYTDANFYSRNFSTSSQSISNSESSGFYGTSRLADSGSNSIVTNFKGTNTYGTINIASSQGSGTDYNIFIMARNDVGSPAVYSNHQIAFSSIHDNMTAADLNNLHDAVEDFQTTLEREV